MLAPVVVGLLTVPLVTLWLGHVRAQIGQVGATLAQAAPSYYGVTPLAATAAASAQATLTIPAPQASQYNYICSLHFNASHDNTATTAVTNGVTTSTNFNGYAIKFSLNNVANQNYDWVEDWQSAPGTGCVKSTAPGTATTFLSPAGTANVQFAWTGTYFQAP
jgi:hypothetical protein